MASNENTKLFVLYGVNQLDVFIENPQLVGERLLKRAKKLRKDFEEHQAYNLYNPSFARRIEALLKEVDAYQRSLEHDDQLELF